MYAGDIYARIRKTGTFVITERHLKLLRHMYVSWDDTEFGAPQIDPKRPYGNSDVTRDIAEILEYPGADEDELSEDLEDLMTVIHAEMGVVLQIILSTGRIRTGAYESDKYGMKWERVS